jgi:hypothetical protein
LRGPSVDVLREPSGGPSVGPSVGPSGGPSVGPSGGPSVDVLRGPSVDVLREPSGGVGSLGLLDNYRSYISQEYHTMLDDIPIDRINDTHFIHYHIFSIWFLSKLDINIPINIQDKFQNVQHFPFFSSLFHVRNNIPPFDH